MNVKALLTDDDAVSPVIGVILMVAITVILAAVIGTFVLGLQNRVGQAAPTASFSWELNDGGDGWGNDNDWVNVTHDGGDKLDVSNINGTIGSDTIRGVNATAWGSSVTAGSTLAIEDDTGTGTTPSGGNAIVDDIAEGEDIRIIWSNPEGDKTQTIGQNEVS